MDPLALVVLLLVTAVALLEAAVTALTRRRPPPVALTGARTPLVQQLAEDPRRTRRALALVRVALLALAFLLATGAAIRGGATPALTAAGATLVLFLLEQHGRLRRFGAKSSWLAPLGAAVLWPAYTLLPSAAQRLAEPAANDGDAEAAAELADALATAPEDRQRMVQALLELERRTVEEIMVPRSDIIGVDLTDDWEDIVAVLSSTPHTRLPVYEGDLDRMIGVLHMKRVAHELARGELTREKLVELARRREAYFVPEGTTLQQQLIAFRRSRRRLAYVVDEYGDVQGLATLDDILEEVVGEFTTQPGLLHRDIHSEPAGSFVIAGSASLREINRALGWHLPTEGPRTLNGLIVEYLESIPEAGTSLKLGDYAVEVLQTVENAVRTARLWPPPASGE